jgi:lauroyl/myristoyl acyltransferase
MLLTLTKLIGWTFARTPEFLLEFLSWLLGSLLYLLYGSRRRMMLGNIRLSFPDRSEGWCRWVGRQSCIRLIETSLLSLASPYFGEARIKAMASATPGAHEVFGGVTRRGNPLVLGTAHLAYWEGLTWIKVLLGDTPTPPEVLTIFRPLSNPKLDEWLKQTRERFGVKLMSRRGGLHEALHVLHRKGLVCILFDQSAGSHGYLTRFLGRECSTTPLPGMLAEKGEAELGFIFARRKAFWRFDVDAILVPHDGTEKGVTVALNNALEQRLSQDEEVCASWLWLHKRWRILDRPQEREKILEKRGGLIN